MSRQYRRVQKKQFRPKGHSLHLYQTMALPERVAYTAKHLELLRSVFGRLLADEHFVTLLRAESITTVPAYFVSPLEKARGNREIS